MSKVLSLRERMAQIKQEKAKDQEVIQPSKPIELEVKAAPSLLDRLKQANHEVKPMPEPEHKQEQPLDVPDKEPEVDYKAICEKLEATITSKNKQILALEEQVEKVYMLERRVSELENDV